MTAFLKEISKGGPISIAENAHKFAQYALSKVPANVLYWFTSRVLNLPPDTAMQTTEFLKSRSDLEILMDDDNSIGQEETGLRTIPSDIERRLERLELEYQALQENHNKSLQLLTNKAVDLEIHVRTQSRQFLRLLADIMLICIIRETQQIQRCPWFSRSRHPQAPSPCN